MSEAFNLGEMTVYKPKRKSGLPKRNEDLLSLFQPIFDRFIDEAHVVAGITKDVLLGRSRKHPVILARHACEVSLHHKMLFPVIHVSQLFHTDHSSVLYGIRTGLDRAILYPEAKTLLRDLLLIAVKVIEEPAMLDQYLLLQDYQQRFPHNFWGIKHDQGFAEKLSAYAHRLDGTGSPAIQVGSVGV